MKLFFHEPLLSSQRGVPHGTADHGAEPEHPVLQHVIRCAVLERLHGALLTNGAREVDERDFGLLFFCQGKSGEAVERRHRIIGDDEVVLSALHGAQEIVTVLHLHPGRRYPLLLQGGPDQLGVKRAVFDVQYSQYLLGVHLSFLHHDRGFPLTLSRCVRTGDLVHDRPENPQLLDGFDELGEPDRFHDIGVHSEAIAFHEVFLFARGGQHDHRYGPELLIPFQALQHLDPVHPGHLEVQEHEDGKTAAAPGKGALGGEVFEDLLAVPHHVHLVGEVALRQRGQGQLHVVGIVLRIEDAFQVAHAMFSSLGWRQHRGLRGPRGLRHRGLHRQ